MKLSIIIPTFNRKELLEHGLKSIKRQDMPFEYEIIVLNEYIEDGTKEIAEKYGARYILTRPNETIRTISWRVPALVINYGVKQANGEVVIITCPEIVHVQKDLIKSMIEAIKDKSVVITNGVDDRNGEVLAQANAFGVSDNFMKYANRPALETRFPFCLAIKKQDFIAIGGYDEDFQQNYCWEDTEVTRRFANNGFEFIKIDKLIIHLYHQRLRYNNPDIQAKWAINKALFESKAGQLVANQNREWGIINVAS